MLKQKKAEMDIILFIVMVVGLLIIAPVLYRIVSTSLGSFSNAINNTSPLASSSVDAVSNSFLTWLDYLILFAFLADLVLLFIFSWLSDTHWIFLLVYIMMAFFTMIFSPYIVEPVNQLFGMSWFSEAVLELPLTNFILTNFTLIVLGVIIVTGIIIYGKFRYGGRNI